MATEQKPTPTEPNPPEYTVKVSWFQVVSAIVYIFFCFEIGVFLIAFPWLPLWEHNFFSSFGPQWYKTWTNPYFRGAMSGLGLVNVAISFSELVRLRRFVKRQN